jgi:hypothetical protein
MKVSDAHRNPSLPAGEGWLHRSRPGLRFAPPRLRSLMVDFNVFDDDPFDVGNRVTDGDGLEARAVEEFFSGRSLSEITLQRLTDGYMHDPAACLVFMTPEAFAFFLPAFMRIALEDYDHADVIPEVVIGRFVEMAEGRDDERLAAIRSSYSTPQIRCVADFLEEMSTHYWHRYPEDLAKRARDAYWGPLELHYPRRSRREPYCAACCRWAGWLINQRVASGTSRPW